MAEPLSLPPVPEPPKGERLKNKVVLLTGAAQGIGEAIVATFASQQAKLIISDIQGEKVEKVAAYWRDKGFDVRQSRLTFPTNKTCTPWPDWRWICTVGSTCWSTAPGSTCSAIRWK